jgi:amidophosphoribosyltransferase
MCGVVGIAGKRPVAQVIYDALTVLQHRGQDAAGIVTVDQDNRLHPRRENGLVRDVFGQREMEALTGDMGLGHVRYPTAGNSSSSEEAQPFYVNSPYGICLAHNGNLTNLQELTNALMRDELRHLHTGSDSEALLNVFAQELMERARPTIAPQDVFHAVRRLHARCRGSYAATALITGHGLVGFRDPFGLRPLVLGSRKTSDGTEYMLASESVALDVCGFDLERDVRPGEAVFIDSRGQLHSADCAETVQHTPCIFEYVYFARPDSIIDGISVYRARMRMGARLGERIARERPNHGIDCVIPVPDTSRTAALEVAQVLGVNYREGLVKNRYVGRTFIMPGQEKREKSVRQKLNTIDLQFRDKTVLLVDDSIVRGTTSQQIIEMVREAGARQVFFASAAPPVRFPNVYGIDMPTAEELIAHGRSEAEICKLMGADWLIYQELGDLVDAVKWKTSPVREFDTSCFSGEYVTGDITTEYLAWLHSERCDDAKQRREQGSRGVRPALRGVGGGA